jgi:hypothetical protein
MAVIGHEASLRVLRQVVRMETGLEDELRVLWGTPMNSRLRPRLNMSSSMPDRRSSIIASVTPLGSIVERLNLKIDQDGIAVPSAHWPSNQKLGLPYHYPCGPAGARDRYSASPTRLWQK